VTRYFALSKVERMIGRGTNPRPYPTIFADDCSADLHVEKLALSDRTPPYRGTQCAESTRQFTLSMVLRHTHRNTNIRRRSLGVVFG
jgi:hypothetical protein